MKVSIARHGKKGQKAHEEPMSSNQRVMKMMLFTKPSEMGGVIKMC